MPSVQLCPQDFIFGWLSSWQVKLPMCLIQWGLSHHHISISICAFLPWGSEETPGPSILPLSGPQLCAGNCMYIYHDPRGIISVTWHLIQHLHLCRNCLSCSPYSRGPPSPVVPFSFIFLLLALPLFLSVSLTCRHQAGSTTRGMTHTSCPVFHPPQYLRPLLTTFDRSLSYLQLNLPTCVFFASPPLRKTPGLCLLGSPSPSGPR